MKHKNKQQKPLRYINYFLLAFCFLTIINCANPEVDTQQPLGGNAVKITNNGDNSLQFVIGATSETQWIYVDLDHLTQVTPTQEPNFAAMAETSQWDLAFQRFNIVSNGGASGDGNVNIAVLSGQDFTTLTKAPSETETTYYQDAFDGDDQDNDPDFVMSNLPTGAINNGWYEYNPQTHSLAARDVVYVIQTSDGQYFKVKMLGYYSTAGTPGYPTFKMAGLFTNWSTDGVTTPTTFK